MNEVPQPVKPLLLDVFSGAGGCSEGYRRAGFDVVGIDNNPKPLRHYPFPWACMDALKALRLLIAGKGILFSDGVTRYLKDFAAIHASPPCQHYSTVTRNPSRHPDFCAATRQLLISAGRPYAIENVMGAPYGHGITLCGSMFNLEHDGEWIQRHRNFETSMMLFQPSCSHRKDRRAITITGQSFVAETREYEHSRQATFATGQRLMGIDWMTRDEMTEAIPPAYTEYIGKHLMAELGGKRG